VLISFAAVVVKVMVNVPAFPLEGEAVTGAFVVTIDQGTVVVMESVPVLFTPEPTVTVGEDVMVI
jgi:hypothetical protein